MPPHLIVQALILGAGILLLLFAAVNVAGQRALLALLGAAFLAAGVWLVPLMAS